MFCQDDNTLSTALAETELAAKAPRTSLTYEEVVKDLISDEKQHLRDLHMIIKVFREELGRLIPPDDIKVVAHVFSAYQVQWEKVRSKHFTLTYW